MDLADMCNPQISKLSGSQSKNHLIKASNGSLISAGEQPLESVSLQLVSADGTFIFLSFQVLLTLKLARSRRRRSWLS